MISRLRSSFVHFLAIVQKERYPLLLLGLAFLLRVVGIHYGLPLMLVDDEAPFTLGSLLMIQLHTLVPALHAADFSAVLYYPPYLSYVLLIPFTFILGFQFLFWHGNPLIEAHILSDLTPYFVAARSLNVFLGTASVYLVYRIAERLFHSRTAAIAAGFLVATSALHVALSLVGRNWMPVSFIFLLCLFILTCPEWSTTRRYFWIFAIAGLGMGVSSVCMLCLVMTGLYYLSFDLRSWRGLWTDLGSMAVYALLFACLTVAQWLLWHGGETFVGSITAAEPKSLLGMLESPYVALSLIVLSEPVLIGLYIAGVMWSLVRDRRFFLFFGVYPVLHIGLFYFLFRLEPRFILPLIPMFALLGGWMVATMWNNRTNIVICALLAIPLVVSARVGYLAIESDTRTQAYTWALAHISSNDRVLVYADGLRLPTQPAALQELRTLDPEASRRMDEAAAALATPHTLYVLNGLVDVRSTAFPGGIAAYATLHGYHYLIYEPESAGRRGMSLSSLLTHGTVVASFNGLGDRLSLAESAFADPLTRLFGRDMFGPDILIYHLP